MPTDALSVSARLNTDALSVSATLKEDKRELDDFIRDLNSSYVEILHCGTRLSLVCPVYMVRQKIPVRTHKCKHLQTWDLESFFHVQPSEVKERLKFLLYVKCPICGRRGTLVKDRTVARYLDELKDVNQIIISSEGEVTPVKVDKMADVIDLTESLCESSNHTAQESQEADPVPHQTERDTANAQAIKRRRYSEEREDPPRDRPYKKSRITVRVTRGDDGRWTAAAEDRKVSVWSRLGSPILADSLPGDRGHPHSPREYPHSSWGYNRGVPPLSWGTVPYPTLDW